MRPRIVAAIGLSALFLVVYGFTNWVASRRSDVGTLYFEWELGIPFVAWMIVPYMSIDLFFLGAPFLCRRDAELSTFCRRVTFAILAAGTCFLLFPLRLGFERQAGAGWLGAAFDAFRGLDPPHNLLPSLHIALRTILAALYVGVAAGLPRLGLRVWFSLIGISTLLTHQHHLADLAGGGILAAFAFHLFSHDAVRHPVEPNRRIATYYGVGAVSLALAAFASRPWGVVLLWPALALGVAARAYVSQASTLYGKRGGKLPWSTRVALAPLLLGQWSSLQWYRRRCRAWDEVAPGVLVGRKLGAREAERAVRDEGITAVLDLAAEFTEAPAFRGLRYLDLPILDLTAPAIEPMRRAAAFIAEEAALGKVYVHCKIGYSRSACAAGAYLLAGGAASDADAAMALLRRARPTIVIRPEAEAALRRFVSRST